MRRAYESTPRSSELLRRGRLRQYSPESRAFRAAPYLCAVRPTGRFDRGHCARRAPAVVGSLVSDGEKSKLVYQRIVIKLSGEALCSKPGSFGIDTAMLKKTAEELGGVHAAGVQVGVVVGGGNIFRGLKGASEGLDRAQSDYMGMLATVINSLALQDALERCGVPTRVMTALEIKQVAEPYIRRRAMRHLERGNVVIFAAGTGNPYFSTDTAAALRAMEIRADGLLKATKVEGIYDRDPLRHAEAKMLERVSYDRFLGDHLGVMDSTAVALCRENGLPIRVFKMSEGNIRRVCQGEHVGTTVSD
jgi:uridylate kinase